jgi:hypothetical protein
MIIVVKMILSKYQNLTHLRIYGIINFKVICVRNHKKKSYFLQNPYILINEINL